ncbi:MAG: AMP-binding protein, partial [Acidimicrobiales bacterium]|nr:AMP-binding protein [Acidimicrobiales bacterium]
MSVHALLENRIGADGPALIQGATGASVSWRDISLLAGQWEDSGLHGPVGLVLADPLAMASHFVAALAAGALVVPLNPSAPRPEQETRLDQFGLRALVTDAGSMPMTAGGLETWTGTVGTLRRAGGPPTGSRHRIGRSLPAEPARTSVLMASSGTTGTPKIIPLTEQQLLATASGVVDHLRLGPGERGYSPLPLFHINGLVVGVLSALIGGSSIVLERQFSRRSFWPTVEAHDVTWLNLVPAILAILAVDGPSDLHGPPAGSEHSPASSGRVRLARSASAPLPAAVQERFEARTGIPVIETYGMTEAASQITANPIGEPRPGSVGQPVGIELQVLARDGSPAEPGECGQVHLRGTRVTRVYWEPNGSSGWACRPAVDSAGWLPTGDIGRIDGGGYLFLVGREGDVINRGGEKIQPREVEEVLL